MSEFNNYRLILEELDSTLSQVDNTEYERFANDVIGADRIFTAGKVVQVLFQIVLQCA